MSVIAKPVISDCCAVHSRSDTVGQTVQAVSNTPQREVTNSAGEHSVRKECLKGGSETVLLVEDEDSLRALNVNLLRGLGYSVLSAQDAAEALCLAQQHPDMIDLLITDLVLPSMNGRDLARALLRVRPEVRVLYVSGYTNSAVVEEGRLEMGVAFLQKPFSRSSFADKIREALAKEPAITERK